MSYILEALKKSEQKRQRDRIPDLLIVQDSTAKKPGRSLRTVFLLAVSLLNAGLLIWWMYPVGSVKTDTKVQTVSVLSNDVTKSPATSSSNAPAEASKDAAVVNMPAQATIELQNEKPAAERHRQTAKNTTAQKALNLNELPSFVQQAVSNTTISGHFYDANPASRIVSINGRIVREGQNVTPLLKLERITPDGIILSYDGYRFFLGMF